MRKRKTWQELKDSVKRGPGYKERVRKLKEQMERELKGDAEPDKT